MYQMTLRRRMPDGYLEEVIFNVQAKDGTERGADAADIILALLVDMEYQANDSMRTITNKPPVRVWVNET